MSDMYEISKWLRCNSFKVRKNQLVCTRSKTETVLMQRMKVWKITYSS